MKSISRPVIVGLALMLLAGLVAGCGHTYDGSNEFYDQHPEYQGSPTYMHPADNDN